MHKSKSFYEEEKFDNKAFYREQKTKRREEVDYQCEVTGATDPLSTHHVLPRCFGGPDVKGNLQILEQDYHTNLHNETISEHQDLLVQRNFLNKKLYKDPTNEKIREQLEKVDDILIKEYVEKLMNIQGETRDKLIALTLESSFKSVRDLNIELRKWRG